MNAQTSQIVTIQASCFDELAFNPEWVRALESGKVLYLPNIGFNFLDSELTLLTPTLLSPKSRNISLDANGSLKGAKVDGRSALALNKMISRYKEYSLSLIKMLLPEYCKHLRLAPTSYRPSQVESRVQSWRADDKRLHIDAFPSRPNRGERILRVFANVNPNGQDRVWRVGEPFERVAQTFLPLCKPYVRWQANALNVLCITKSFRTQYDHLMLQLHDRMKYDLNYQTKSPQQKVLFAPQSVWICFSDQTSHAAMSGQYMMEQTMHLAVDKLYDPSTSPLQILSRLSNFKLL
jgi:3-deoxy-D-manno-oct-2-ulosonic acid (Kdo) hydroxylase